MRILLCTAPPQPISPPYCQLLCHPFSLSLSFLCFIHVLLFFLPFFLYPSFVSAHFYSFSVISFSSFHLGISKIYHHLPQLLLPSLTSSLWYSLPLSSLSSLLAFPHTHLLPPLPSSLSDLLPSLFIPSPIHSLPSLLPPLTVHTPPPKKNISHNVNRHYEVSFLWGLG